MITGVDLVKEQIRVAAGEPLSVQELPPLRGHVIECRVNAEDPNRNFQPSPGRIVTFHPPGGNGVRLDTHVYAGYTVPPFYDSMIAKVICQGRDREEALAKMRLALETFIIEGPTTTIPFLARVMQNPRFQSGDVDTKFLEREPDLMKEPGSVKIDVLLGVQQLTAGRSGRAVGDDRRACVVDHRRRARQCACHHPAESSEASSRAQAVPERAGVLLAGERHAQDGRLRSGQLPWSTRVVVEGKTVLLTTTNGTRAPGGAGRA